MVSRQGRFSEKCTNRAYVQNLGSVEHGSMKIFEVAKRWVVVNVWANVSINYCHRPTCLMARLASWLYDVLLTCINIFLSDLYTSGIRVSLLA